MKSKIFLINIYYKIYQKNFKINNFNLLFIKPQALFLIEKFQIF